MSKKKFYAVKKGYKVGVYNTWDECKKQVNGFSGAEYKSFQTLDEAYEYMGVKKDVKVENGDFVKAYVDGSYEHAIREYGSGVVILRNDIVEKTYSIKGNEESLVGMRNVAGEIEASKMAMKYCIDNNIRYLKLYFDYEGSSMTARVDPRTTARTGDHVKFALDAEKIHVFDKETQVTITN